MLSPSVFFNLVVGMIAAFRVFTAAYVATNGGPMYSTEFYILYLFTNAFQYLHMGFASALAWMFVLVILVLVALQLFLGSQWVYYEGATQQ
jgi:multiple sugar transport system permease protein